jgi:hypothetical protein
MAGDETKQSEHAVLRRKWKVFDPRDPQTGSAGAELSDATVVERGGRWWMYVAGQANGFGPTELYSASLDVGSPLSPNGWTLDRDAHAQLVPLAGRNHSSEWDGKGGRHCPSYVKGWDPTKSEWVERIYYAGAVDNLWGPYTIGFLEWDGETWVDQPEPAFAPKKDWEHGSVYEPNLVYHDGRWKMWYVAGSNHEDYLVHGYSESNDGRTGWSDRAVFAQPEMKMFDFCVRQRSNCIDAIFARVWLKEGTPPPETGLWWCRAEKPSGTFSDWGQPIQIMTAANCGWHSGPWKPSIASAGDSGERTLVFFDGLYRTSDPGPFPFAFTLGCLEMILPPA